MNSLLRTSCFCRVGEGVKECRQGRLVTSRPLGLPPRPSGTRPQLAGPDLWDTMWPRALSKRGPVPSRAVWGGSSPNLMTGGDKELAPRLNMHCVIRGKGYISLENTQAALSILERLQRRVGESLEGGRKGWAGPGSGARCMPGAYWALAHAG